MSETRYAATDEAGMVGLTAPQGDGGRREAAATLSGVLGARALQLEVVAVSAFPGAATGRPTSLEVDGVEAAVAFEARPADVGGGWRLAPPVVAPPKAKLTLRLDGGTALVATALGHWADEARP